MALSLNAKLASFFVHPHPYFTVTHAPVQQSSAPEDASRIYAEIERLKQLAETIGWNDADWVEARQLYEQWWNLDEGDSPLNPLGDWLSDQVENKDRNAEYEPDIRKRLLVDADQWVSLVTAILKAGFQDYERFSKEGDLSGEAEQLWMLYDLLDPAIRHARQYELNILHFELESHLDPQGEFHTVRMQRFYKQRAAELHAQGKHHEAEQWLKPKEQWECPSKCSEAEWANIIKPFNRRSYAECFDELLARVELARLGFVPGERTAIEALQTYKDDAHTKIKEAIQQGADAGDVQLLINQYGTRTNSFGLTKFAEQYRESLERQQDIADALDDLLLRGEPPQIRLADYVPADWVPMFRVLRDGLKFSDEAIVMTVMAGVAAMLPPKVRIRGKSMEEIPTVWVFHIGSSGTAKSVLLRWLINGPMAKPIAFIDGWNERDQQSRKSAADDGENVPAFRKRNLIYTAPSTQGIRCDMAEHGEDVPGLLVHDELNGWLKQMADVGGAGVGDVEFWLSSYDGAYHNDVFADAKKSREVRAGKLSVIGGIQPQVFLEQLHAGNANGFNSRPLFVHLSRSRRVLVEGDENTKKLNDVLGDLYLAALQDGNNAYVLSAGAEQLFINLFNQLENLSLEAGSEEVEALWAKGPGQVLRVAAAIHFIRIATGQEELVERGMVQPATVVSERSLQLAANLVMAGKTRAVELHERARNPMLELADKLLEKARKKQGKAPGQGVALSAIRKSWSSKNRPTIADLKQMAVMLQSRGLVQLVDGDKSIRVVR